MIRTVSAEFIPGLELARGFYHDAVAPILADVPHSAALLGSGSDVLGFDTPRSTDHGWGPRLQIFVQPAEVAGVDALLEAELPQTYGGWPVRFGWDDVPVTNHVTVAELGPWLEKRLGFDPRPSPTYRNWLAAPKQVLLDLTAGAVFSDDAAELHELRTGLEWYPDDVWLWLLACQWRRKRRRVAR